MQTVWPMLTFYLSVLLALSVGAIALAAGDSAVGAVVKSLVALLVFSTVGWILNVVVFATRTSSADRQNSEAPGAELDSDDENMLFTDQAVEPDSSISPQSEPEQPV